MEFTDKQDLKAVKKAEIRSVLRSKRRALDGEQVAAASHTVCEKLALLDEFKQARLILSYRSAKNEIDCSLIDEIARKNGKKVAYPLCIEDGGLRLFVPNDSNAFVVGSYGILEPDINASEEVFAEELDMIIVPAVAFDSKKMRLGQGGGYYDRLLKKSSAFTVGVGYDFQMIEGIPHEAHDVALDRVITPSNNF